MITINTGSMINKHGETMTILELTSQISSIGCFVFLLYEKRAISKIKKQLARISELVEK